VDSRTLLHIAHDIGLAMWFGGSLMGAVGLNGATIEVDDHTQRTRVANAGWFRWAPLAGLALSGHVLATALLGRVVPALGHGDDRPLRRTRTVVTAAAVAATIETGLSGRIVARAGDVPVATAVHPIAATPPEVAAAQGRLRVAQWLVPAFTSLLWVLDALQDRQDA